MPTIAVLVVAMEIGILIPALITINEGVPEGGYYFMCQIYLLSSSIIKYIYTLFVPSK